MLNLYDYFRFFRSLLHWEFFSFTCVWLVGAARHKVDPTTHMNKNLLGWSVELTSLETTLTKKERIKYQSIEVQYIWGAPEKTAVEAWGRLLMCRIIASSGHAGRLAYRISSIRTRAFYKFQVSCWQALYSRARSIWGRGLFNSIKGGHKKPWTFLCTITLLIHHKQNYFIQHTMSDLGTCTTDIGKDRQ